MHELASSYPGPTSLGNSQATSLKPSPASRSQPSQTSLPPQLLPSPCLLIPHGQATKVKLASASTPSTTSFHTAHSHLPSSPSAASSSTVTASHSHTKMSPPPRRASPIKRLQAEYKSSHNIRSSVIGRLEPVNDDLFRWEAVIRGKGLGKGYDGGRWKLDIQIPQEYPNAPPKIRFVTQIVAANVDFKVSCLG